MLNRNKISSPKSQIPNFFENEVFHPIIKLPIVTTLISLAILERVVFDLGPNVELVTLATFCTAFYVGRRMSYVVPIVILALSDLLLGNTSIMLFTWSAYLTIALMAVYLSNMKKSGWQKVLLATGGGIAGSTWFFLWTNFGVWLLDSWGMYPDTPAGLISSYVNGLPFLRYQMVSNLIILFIVFTPIETIRECSHIFRKKVILLQLPRR